MSAKLMIGKLYGSSEVLRSAKVSECGRYRYELTRTWDPRAGLALFMALNPSVADGRRDDHSVRKMIGFCRQWALGGFALGNLFAFRSTDPRELHKAHRRGDEVVGPLNLEHIRALAQDASRVIVAWGSHAKPYPAHVARVIEALGDRPLWCLGTTNDGHPRHPLTLPYSTVLEPFALGAASAKR